MMNPVEKKKSFFENHPKVCYALYAVLDEYFISAINTFILTAGFVWGDRYRRKNLVNQKKIEEYLKNKENNGF